ncbi:MAG: CinA family protein [Proteobacteria bacterium]|nr:CinA family protein [Pseudomonadota bacterium]
MTSLNKKIELLVNQLGKVCQDKRITLVTAESCTGGGIAYFITKEPQCSAMLERGYVTYSNQAKVSLLEVSPEALQIFGAVSKKVTQQMAEGALKNSTAQVAVATSGIAGEDIESGQSKTGVVWIACAGIAKKTLIREFSIKGEREEFVLHTILTAFELLYEFIS